MDEWTDLARRIAKTRPPWAASEDVGRLYVLAHAEGLRLLRKRGNLDDERIRDLVSAFFVERLDEIVAASVPRAYFCAALKNRAKDWWKKKGSEVREDRPADDPGAAHTVEYADQLAEQMDEGVRARAVLEELSPLERQVWQAIADGADRVELARALNTSRANVDQIASRSRKRLRKAGLG